MGNAEYDGPILEAAKKRVYELFKQKLAAKYPNHPWLKHKKTAKDFDYIYYPDQTCGVCPERKPGMVLAYDEFNPEGATWFCDGCWEDLGIVQPMFTIVEERHKP